MLSMLGMFIAEYNDLDTSPYTKESVDAFQEAMDEALAIMYDGAACTDEQILAAIEKLMDAAEALVFKPDKSLLALAIEAAETQDLTGVVPKAKENLQAKLTAAKDVYDDEDATVEAIDTAYNALIEAMADLQKGGNKAALQVLLTLAGKMVKANYTPASWADFEDSIEAANVVVADENALQPHVDKASSDLTESMKKLVRVANFAALSSAVSIAQNIVDNIDDYVASTVVGLASELDKAKLLLENTNATQAEVNAQATALNTKILTARIKPDRSPLLNALNQAKAVNLNLYTEESGKGLSALMVKAQSILDKSDKDLRQSEVNSMARDLKDAITGLVAKSAKDSGKTKAAAAETKNKAAGKTAGSKSPAPSAAKNSGTASGGNTAAAAGTTTRGANPSATAGTQTAGLNAAAGDAVTAADEGAAAGVQDSMTPAQTTEKTEKNPSESIPYGLYGLGIILLLCLAGFLIRWNQKRQKE